EKGREKDEGVGRKQNPSCRGNRRGISAFPGARAVPRMLDTKLCQSRATSWRWWENQSAPGRSVLPPLAGFPKKKPRRNGAEALDDEMETGCCLLRHDMTKTKRHPKWRQQNHFRRPARAM